MNERLALLVLANSAPESCAELARDARSADFDVFVHVDAKADLAQFQAAMGTEVDGVHWLTSASRHSIHWGGFSMIEATGALVKSAMERHDYHSLSLVSDDTAFLVRPETARSMLLAQPNRIDDHAIDPASTRGRRYAELYALDLAFSAVRQRDVEDRAIDLKALDTMYADVKKLAELGKVALDLRGGAQWWSLQGSRALSYVERLELDNHLRLSFQYSAVPYDSFFQTMAAADGLVEGGSQNLTPSPMLFDFTRNPRPYVYREVGEVMDHLKKTWRERVFVRKVADPLLHQRRDLWTEVRRDRKWARLG